MDASTISLQKVVLERVLLSLVTEIGTHIEVQRAKYFKETHLNSPLVDDNGDSVSRSVHESNCAVKYPRSLFLTGANGLQTQAVAASNGGSGLIFVSEIKMGKSKYTALDGSYGPLLSFYERHIEEKTYRKAEKIPYISECRIHLLAAGVKED